ncbi:NAD-dependent epimerase/dehydratase family protein [Sneathiella aquimaris]|uniref:NAD-dependent epimerase/dehydratase family protein n=1 Tax=Sneathiella aquimaris TaxID=2599305 RepID=UPI00146F3895|nr:NAD-dependent epimerase/dehydratase family protein [Sneathiella aquimaris]
MKTIIIFGAQGRLGFTVTKHFASAGFNVVAVSRSGHVDGLASSIEHRQADALNEQDVIRAAKGADFIFNGLNPLYTDWRTHALPMAENIMKAAAIEKAVHLFPGNIYGYGADMPALLNEQTPDQPTTEKGSIRLQMETLFRRYAENGAVRTRIIRAGDFFGGEKTGSWFDLIVVAKLHKNIFQYPGDPTINHAWAYLPDLAEAFVSLAGHDQSFGSFECFTFEGHTLTGHQLQSALERLTQRSLKRKTVPWPVLRLGGIVIKMWAEIAKMSYLWFTPHRLDGTRLSKITGDKKQTPLPLALAQSLKDLGYQDLVGKQTAD